MMETYSCRSCGYTTEVVDGAKFCQQCGTRFKEVITQPSFTPAEPPSQGNVRAGTKIVIGPVIKEHLLAQLLENGRKKSGKFQVRNDGVIYVTSARWGHQVIQAKWDEIARVGLGMKDNILAINLKDGRELLIKMGGAHRWVRLIQSVKQ